MIAASDIKGIPQRDRLVILASSLGTVFEWYDFFVYGILASLLGKLFFATGNPTTELLFSLFAFGVGFFFRPLGAIFFGILGDKVGRKYTFLITISLMGGATATIGLLPTQAAIGIAAPMILLLLRALQGMALGGEYGGAAIYVAEHAPPNKRGMYTSWIQVSVVGGFLLAVSIVLISRLLLTEAQFSSWGWRVPFLASIIMLGISLYIRLQLSESPIFQKMKAAGTTSKNPFRESFNNWPNAKLALVALFGVAAGLTVIYYTSQFGTLYFLQGTARIAEQEALLYMAIGASLAAPLYVACGWLSDRWGRKKLLLLGYGLTLVLLFPLFHLMADAANPALARATKENPVQLAVGSDCKFSIFAAKQSTDCAKAMAFLAKRGVSYTKVESNSGAGITASIGAAQLGGFDEAQYKAALIAAGYPDKADPTKKQPLLIILAIAVMVGLSAMTYGQVAAILVELFPARIRYTSMSVPYHIGTGYFGGFLPFISQYIVVTTGNAYSGLWYTIVVVAVAFLVSLFFLPETRGRDISV
jgi:MFS family permease